MPLPHLGSTIVVVVVEVGAVVLVAVEAVVLVVSVVVVAVEAVVLVVAVVVVAVEAVVLVVAVVVVVELAQAAKSSSQFPVHVTRAPPAESGQCAPPTSSPSHGSPASRMPLPATGPGTVVVVVLFVVVVGGRVAVVVVVLFVVVVGGRVALVVVVLVLVGVVVVDAVVDVVDVVVLVVVGGGGTQGCRSGTRFVCATGVIWAPGRIVGGRLASAYRNTLLPACGQPRTMPPIWRRPLASRRFPCGVTDVKLPVVESVAPAGIVSVQACALIMPHAPPFRPLAWRLNGPLMVMPSRTIV